jgi:hypothetical protein
LVDAACATRDLPYDGELIPARALHRMTLAALADNYAMVVPQARALI